jgi:hypothetical protein
MFLLLSIVSIVTMSVSVDYTPIVELSSGYVEVNGTPFSCSQDCTTGIDCCNTVSDSREATGCVKCYCQGFGAGCNPGGHNGCTGTGCDSQTESNANIYGSRVTSVMSCTDAITIVRTYPSANVYNASAVLTQCNPTQQLLCCKSDPSVNSDECGSYWGPNAITGDCDGMMQFYCGTTQGQQDPLCNCINSPLPLPECVDSTCANTSAFKTSTMLNNQCVGNYQFCEQFFTLSGEAKENVIEDSNVVQNCNQYNNGSSGSASPSALSNTSLLIFVAVGAVVVLLIVILAVTVKLSRKATRLNSHRYHVERVRPPLYQPRTQQGPLYPQHKPQNQTRG